MKTMQVQWEDEENNRIVAMTVDFAIRNQVVEVAAIAPQRVTFVCPESGSPLRTIRVWTEAGRRHLESKFRASGRLDELHGRLAGHHAAELAVI
jgi:hypothetical protein